MEAVATRRHICGMKRPDDLKRFYDILGVLNDRSGGARLLSEHSRAIQGLSGCNWPLP
jgi:hypothetical protein